MIAGTGFSRMILKRFSRDLPRAPIAPLLMRNRKEKERKKIVGNGGNKSHWWKKTNKREMGKDSWWSKIQIQELSESEELDPVLLQSIWDQTRRSKETIRKPTGRQQNTFRLSNKGRTEKVTHWDPRVIRKTTEIMVSIQATTIETMVRKNCSTNNK